MSFFANQLATATPTATPQLSGPIRTEPREASQDKFMENDVELDQMSHVSDLPPDPGFQSEPGILYQYHIFTRESLVTGYKSLFATGILGGGGRSNSCKRTSLATETVFFLQDELFEVHRRKIRIEETIRVDAMMQGPKVRIYSHRSYIFNLMNLN